jgi:hypothetical protein
MTVHVAGLVTSDEQDLVPAQEEHVDGDREFGVHGRVSFAANLIFTR